LNGKAQSLFFRIGEENSEIQNARGVRGVFETVAPRRKFLRKGLFFWFFFGGAKKNKKKLKRNQLI
jgi:hypothetical protein